MPKPMRRSPRAPIEAYGRTACGANGFMARSLRMRLMAAARSGAVSAKVPSKSNSAARAGRLLLTHAAQEIVDVAVASEPVALRQRVVGHADQLGDAQRFLREVDTRDLGAAAGHRFAEDAAAAAHIEHALRPEARALVDPVEAQRIDVVQRAELAVRVPPAMGELAEFLQLCRVGVHRSHCPKKNPAEAGPSLCCERLLVRRSRLARGRTACGSGARTRPGGRARG